MHRPGLLEAILVAEVGRIEVHLLTDRTDHRRLLAASRSPALAIALHS